MIVGKDQLGLVLRTFSVLFQCIPDVKIQRDRNPPEGVRDLCERHDFYAKQIDLAHGPAHNSGAPQFDCI